MTPDVFLYSLKQRLNAKNLSSGVMDVISMIYDAKFPMEMQFIGEATIGDFTKVPNFHNNVPILQLLALTISQQVLMVAEEDSNMKDAAPDPRIHSYLDVNVQYAVAIIKKLASEKWGTDPCTISAPDLTNLGAKVGFTQKPPTP